MSLIKSSILFLLLLISYVAFPQEVLKEVSQLDDSLALKRRQEYEARLKYIEEIKRRREKDPQRYLDSIAKIKEKRRYEEANARIKDYLATDILQLKEIDLTGARLKELPEWVLKAKNLEILVLDYNQISSLPKELSKLELLRRIYWKNNSLGKSKIKIPKLEGIEKIDLSGNALTRLPKVHRVDGLEELILENNSFTKLPAWRGRRLNGLVEIDLSGNPIVLDKRWYGLLDHIEILKLNKCEIDYVHPAFYKMNGLTELQIQVNDLAEVPEGISSLSKLTKLSFYKNRLSELPSDFFLLKDLKVVDLYYNEFKRIPNEIELLQQLEILYLSFNELYDIPSALGKLSKLEELYIHHNRLSEIPNELRELDRLRVFHIQDNYIPTFPRPIIDMKSLVDLDISNTSIESIPIELTQLDLKNFYWRNLEIDINNPEAANTRKTLLKLIEKGTNVVPNVRVETVGID